MIGNGHENNNITIMSRVELSYIRGQFQYWSWVKHNDQWVKAKDGLISCIKNELLMLHEAFVGAKQQ